jgi:chromosome segregation ATPase
MVRSCQARSFGIFGIHCNHQADLAGTHQFSLLNPSQNSTSVPRYSKVSAGSESSLAEMETLRKAASDKDKELAKLTAEIKAVTQHSAEKDSELASLSAELRAAKDASRSGSRSGKARKNSGKFSSGDLERESGSSQKIVEVRDAEIKRLERGAEELRRVLSKAKEENMFLEEQLRARTGTSSHYISAMHLMFA